MQLRGGGAAFLDKFESEMVAFITDHPSSLDDNPAVEEVPVAGGGETGRGAVSKWQKLKETVDLGGLLRRAEAEANAPLRRLHDLTAGATATFNDAPDVPEETDEEDGGGGETAPWKKRGRRKRSPEERLAQAQEEAADAAAKKEEEELVAAEKQRRRVLWEEEQKAAQQRAAERVKGRVVWLAIADALI